MPLTLVEQLDRLEHLVVKERQTEPASNKARLLQRHRLRLMTDHIVSTTHKLDELRQDNDAVLTAFLDRLTEIRHHHSLDPAAGAVDEGEQFDHMFKQDPVLDFSGEEAFGRYLDLHQFYNKYINSKFGEPIEYTDYLDIFSQPPNKLKNKTNRQYTDYVSELLEYLIHFFERVEPLIDLEAIISEVGPELEERLKKVCELLHETIVRTKEYAERKQGLSYEEMVAEREEEEEVRVDKENDDEDEERRIYNPLKLPMGWDGKPIPYWLYKLHGLGEEIKCEICGDYSYRGRRAFERHFKERRHENGMRCLGIPNTKSFHEITSIEDAEKLWQRIKQRRGAVEWRPDVEEEYEDREGNVYNKKIYSELQRQGLV